MSGTFLRLPMIPGDACWPGPEGDRSKCAPQYMIVLKRLRPVRPSEIAERVPGSAMPLRAIATEVHQMRRDKRRQRA